MKIRCANLFLIGIAILTCDMTAIGQTDQKLTLDGLKIELSRRLDLLQESFDHVQGKGRLRIVVDFDKAKQQLQQRGEDVRKITEQGKHLTEVREISFAASGRYRQCDLESRLGSVDVNSSAALTSKEPERSVFCAGPRGSFALRWSEIDNQPQIRSFTAENSDPDSRYATYVNTYLQSPYSLSFGHLTDLLQDPNFKLARFEMVTLDGHDCPRVFFEWGRFPKGTPGKQAPKPSRLVGSFITDPAMGYALRASEYSNPDKPWRNMVANVEYQPRAFPHELPLPLRIDRVVNGSLREEMTFERLTRTVVADSRFTLTTYGLPEMDRPVTAGNRNTLAYRMGGAAVALLGLAGWLRRRSSMQAA